MANSREVKTLGQLTVFTRPTSADYEAADGTTQTAAIDEPRFEYTGGTGTIPGIPLGMKFGDGDKLEILMGPWFNEDKGLVILRALAEPGETVFQTGQYSGLGVTGWKTHVFRWQSGDIPPAVPFEVFPAAPNDGITRYCAGVLGYVLNLVVEDLETMEIFNDLVNSEGF